MSNSHLGMNLNKILRQMKMMKQVFNPCQNKYISTYFTFKCYRLSDLQIKFCEIMQNLNSAYQFFDKHFDEFPSLSNIEQLLQIQQTLHASIAEKEKNLNTQLSDLKSKISTKSHERKQRIEKLDKKCKQLVEQLKLKNEKIQPHLDQLTQMSEQLQMMNILQTCINARIELQNCTARLSDHTKIKSEQVISTLQKCLHILKYDLSEFKKFRLECARYLKSVLNEIKLKDKFSEYV